MDVSKFKGGRVHWKKSGMKGLMLYWIFQDGFQVFPDDGSTSPQHVPVYLEVTVPNDVSTHAQCAVSLVILIQ